MNYSERLVAANTPATNDLFIDRAKADLTLRIAQINLDKINLQEKSDKLKGSKTLDFREIYETDCAIALKVREIEFLDKLAKELF